MTMPLFNISIGILTWRSYGTLVNTLESYKRSGLLDMVNDVCLFAQEAGDLDYKIASEYGINIIMTPTNVGIGKGLATLTENAETDNILLLENDWVILPEMVSTISQELSKGISVIERGVADVVKFRSRYKFGDPLYTLQFANREMESPKHLFECVHWRENPDLDFPEYIYKDIDTGLYYANSKYANQTNNPCLYKKEFYLKNIAPFAGQGIDLEGKIDGWWQEQNFTVAHGEGLFTHYRIDR
jgi:hypothetical protein